MRVGLPRSAGSRLQPLLLLLAVLLLAVPAAAGAQEPAAVVFDETPARVTSATSATFAFSADGAASFACATDGAPSAPCPSPFTIDGLAQGSHTFTVHALDAAGGTVAEGGFTWVIDLDKPTATIVTGPSGTVPTGKAVVTFESLDADLARLECQLGLEPYDECTSPLDVDVAQGLNVLRVRAVDEAGNVGEPAVLEWTGAEPAPAKPSLAGPPAQTASRDATFTFTAAGAQTYACTLDGSQLADCVSPQKVTVDKDGKHTFEVRGIAPGGAEGPATSLTWTVDTGQPAVTFAASPAKLTNSGVAAFVLASEPGVTLTCRLVRPGASDPFAPCGTSKTYAGLARGRTRSRSRPSTPRATPARRATPGAWTRTRRPSRITARPPEVSTDASAELAFVAGEEGSSLSCALDGGEFAPCESPVTVRTRCSARARSRSGRPTRRATPAPSRAPRGGRPSRRRSTGLRRGRGRPARDVHVPVQGRRRRPGVGPGRRQGLRRRDGRHGAAHVRRGRHVQGSGSGSPTRPGRPRRRRPTSPSAARR
jgi:hypothetical protein